MINHTQFRTINLISPLSLNTKISYEFPLIFLYTNSNDLQLPPILFLYILTLKDIYIF